MAKFTSTAELNLRWFGNEIFGAANATHRIPDALADEFAAAFQSTIPGFAWVEQDETTAFTADIAAKVDIAGDTMTGQLTATAGIIANAVTATTLSTKGRPWHDVRGYGAAGDGVTDDTTAILAAVAAATDGVVFVPAGTYVVSGTVALSSGQVFIGVGPKSKIIRAASMSVAVLSAASATDIYIGNLTIDGNRDSTPANNANMIDFDGVDRGRIVGVIVQNSTSLSPAIMLEASNNCVVSGCHFENVGYGVVTGVVANDSRQANNNVVANCTGQTCDLNFVFFTASLGSTSSTSIIRNNAAIGNSFASCGDAMIEFGINNYDFACVGNTLRGSSSTRTGILVRDTVGGTVVGNAVIGIRGTTADGISVIDQYGSITDLSIGPNMVRDCTRYGLLLDSVRRVSVSGGAYNANASHGVALADVLDFTLSGVVSRGNGGHGFSIGISTASVGRGSISGCIAIDNSTASAGSADGFVTIGTGTGNVVFTGCIATDTATASKKQRNGINAFEGTDITITGCRLGGNATGRIANSITTNLYLPDVTRGNSFPSPAVTNERFWRNDLGVEFYYDGTRWVSSTLYREVLGIGDALLPLATSSQTPQRWVPWHSTYDLWLDKAYVVVFPAATNDASNYWSFAIQSVNSTNGATTIATVTTSAATAANWTTTETSIGALMGTSTKSIKVIGTKAAGTPGNCHVIAAISYRLVGT